MSRRRSRPLLLLLLFVLGCGGGSTVPVSSPAPTPTPTPTTPNLTGDWDIGLFNPTTNAPLFQFLGSLTTQGAGVSGTFRINDPQSEPPCIPASQDIQVTGSINDNNVLTLSSAAFSGSVATVNIQLPLSDGYAIGTAQIDGPSCAVKSSAVQAFITPSVTGTYTGTMSTDVNGTVTGPGGAATIVLTQAAANADGQFPVQGTIAFTSTPCIVSTTLSGIITGGYLQLNGAIPGINFIAVETEGPITFNNPAAELYVPPGVPSCAAGFYAGTFVEQ